MDIRSKLKALVRRFRPIPEIHEADFSGEEVTLDEHRYLHCTFKNCTLRFKGKGGSTMAHSKVTDCKVHFVDEAGNTIDMLREMYHGGFHEIVSDIFQYITTPK